MGHRSPWRQLLAGMVLVHTLGGCQVEQPWEEPGDMASAETEAPELLGEEPSVSAPRDAGHSLSCEDIRPEELGESRSLIIRAHAHEADCGPGVSNGAGYLALFNGGSFGVAAWTIVTSNGRKTETLAAGDFGSELVPMRDGFHILRFGLHDNATLVAYAANGQFLRQTSLSPILALDLAPDPRGGVVIAWWAPGEGGAPSLLVQAFDEKGRPRSAPHTVMTLDTLETPGIIVGVDQRGRTLVLWRTGASSTWMGQWLRWDASPRTPPFMALEDPDPSGIPGGRLQPLVGEGLVLQLHSEWVRLFPSAEPTSLPAPVWLAENPGSDLVLIRHRRAYALVPPPTPVEDAGCQERLLFYSREGVACGELTLPFGGSACTGRKTGIGLDGTVIQQIELNIPANDQCAWRWWPRLLR